MAGKKIKFVAISDERERKISLEKRIESLFKKASELVTLCDVDVAVIIHDPKEHVEALWPSQEEVERKLSRFLNVPEPERYRKMMTQEHYLIDIAKSNLESIPRISKKINDRESGYLIKELLDAKTAVKDFDTRQTNVFAGLLTDALKMIEERNQELDKLEEQQHQPSSLAPASQIGAQSYQYHHQGQEPAPFSYSYDAARDQDFMEEMLQDKRFMETMFPGQDSINFNPVNVAGSRGQNNMGFHQSAAGTSSENDATIVSPNEIAKSSTEVEK